MSPNRASTQDFVQVKDIIDNVVIRKDEQMVMVVLASSINFALKSYDEQRAILSQFQQFLNTLDFTLQIHMQSRRLNVEPYLEVLGGLEASQNNDLMRVQLREYIEFIRSYTRESDVMNKNFFVVVEYSPTVKLGKGVANLFSSKNSESLAETSFEEHRAQLEQRVNLVVEGLARIGVRTAILGKDELVELFYHTFNPNDSTGTAPQQNG